MTKTRRTTSTTMKKNKNEKLNTTTSEKKFTTTDDTKRRTTTDGNANDRRAVPRHAQYSWLRNVAHLDHLPAIKGYDHEQAFNLTKFLESLATTGFQAANLAKAIDVVNIMRREKAFLFFGFTSNMISSGLREPITYLAKRKHVDFIVTAAGGVEEDAIKCLKPFVVGEFDVPGEQLFEHGINRTGNIFVPNDRFAYFDTFLRTFLEKLYENYTLKGKVVNTAVFTKELGLALNDPSSFLFWAAKNNIPVVCPALMDGSIGDLVHFFRQRHPDFVIDVASDMDLAVKAALHAEKSGALILGAGMVKHYILNANIFREGLDYTVYINTSQEYDGSDSGARIEEAITWGKVKARTPAVKVHCDATIAFPLLLLGTFAKP